MGGRGAGRSFRNVTEDNASLVQNLDQLLPSSTIVADSAEPKSIAELGTLGVNVLPCTKRAESVELALSLTYTQGSTRSARSAPNAKSRPMPSWSLLCCNQRKYGPLNELGDILPGYPPNEAKMSYDSDSGGHNGH
jgi:hypothetical protein